MLINEVLFEFLRSYIPNWGLNGGLDEIRLELKERTLKIICQSVDAQKEITHNSSLLSQLDIGVDMFLVCCTGHPSFGIHCHQK
jgi:hypothetical protein